MRTLLWIRGKDLRLHDHQPLRAALSAGEVIPLFVLDPFFFTPTRARRLPHRMQFLLQSLTELQQAFAVHGSRLLIAQGHSVDVVPELAARFRVERVAAQRWVEPFATRRDAQVRARLNVPFDLFEGETLAAPGTLRSGAGTPYAVYTPFARAFREREQIAEALPAPKRLPALPAEIVWQDAPVPSLAQLGIAHNPHVIAGGERAAHDRLRQLVVRALGRYDTDRDRLDLEGTSRLSADLKFGTLSVRHVWHAVSAAPPSPGRDKFLAELIWREFSHATLWDRPELLQQPFRRDFAGFPWSRERDVWKLWADGQTGYPIVDAAARQLLREGFVHNRARMISASFLTKHLMTDYRLGEAHYMKYLVDGDWAQNNMGWQWSAGCGADAQPYFRVFNPTTQGQKFDPLGNYVRKYVPELARLPAKVIFEPWKASASELSRAGVVLGQDYPRPIVEHSAGRARFLATASTWLERARGGQSRA